MSLHVIITLYICAKFIKNSIFYTIIFCNKSFVILADIGVCFMFNYCRKFGHITDDISIVAYAAQQGTFCYCIWALRILISGTVLVLKSTTKMGKSYFWLVQKCTNAWIWLGSSTGSNISKKTPVPVWWRWGSIRDSSFWIKTSLPMTVVESKISALISAWNILSTNISSLSPWVWSNGRHWGI